MTIKTTKMFKKGVPITCMRQLDKIFKADGWIFFNHKPQHVGFWSSMRYRTLALAIKGKILWEAETIMRVEKEV